MFNNATAWSLWWCINPELTFHQWNLVSFANEKSFVLFSQSPVVGCFQQHPRCCRDTPTKPCILRVIWDPSESVKYIVFFFHTSFMRNIIQVSGILMKFGDSSCASINQPTKIKTYLFKTCPKTSRTIVFQALFLLLCFVGFKVRNISTNLRINHCNSIFQIVPQPTFPDSLHDSHDVHCELSR